MLFRFLIGEEKLIFWMIFMIGNEYCYDKIEY